MGLRVIVQSEKDAAFVESRVDAFWEEFKQTLNDMSEEEFDKYKTTVINKKLEDHKNMWEE
jgi:insulysin